MRASLLPLDDPRSDAAASDVVWCEVRGWFDAVVKAARQNVREDGRQWSNPEQVPVEGTASGDTTQYAPPDSFSDPCTEWWPRGGRDVSVTFRTDDEAGPKCELPQGIERIEGVVEDIIKAPDLSRHEEDSTAKAIS